MSDIENRRYRYWAFISYSSKDTPWARWLHARLENYTIPVHLRGRSTPVGEPAPERFRPLFRDRDELPASSDLTYDVEDALRASRYLIVVCSRNAAASKWVNKEIASFQTLGREH